jgi:hypothetical protein
MDITIEVMLPARGGDWTQETHGSYRVLTVVDVYDHLKVTPVIGMPRTGYIHVTGVPDQRFARIKDVLLTPWTVGTATVERRLWRGVASRVPANARNRLLADRQITVTWTQFRNFLQDLQEQRDLTDADIA